MCEKYFDFGEGCVADSWGGDAKFRHEFENCLADFGRITGWRVARYKVIDDFDECFSPIKVFGGDFISEEGDIAQVGGRVALEDDGSMDLCDVRGLSVMINGEQHQINSLNSLINYMHYPAEDSKCSSDSKLEQFFIHLAQSDAARVIFYNWCCDIDDKCDYSEGRYMLGVVDVDPNRDIPMAKMGSDQGYILYQGTRKYIFKEDLDTCENFVSVDVKEY